MPITPEVSPSESPLTAKKKPTRSAKPKSEQPIQPGKITIEGPIAPEPANPAPKPVTPPFSWDRTQEEARMKFAPFPPIPGNARKLTIGPFLEYWNALPVPLHGSATMYAYRLIPIMKGVSAVDDYGKRTITHPFCFKVFREHGPLTEEQLLKQTGMGCGKYSLRLNDSRIVNRGNPDAATIVFGDLDTAGRPWGDFPPDLDYSRLDMNDERNSQFIVWARSRNLIPNETQQETEDMQSAQAGVADRLTSTVERLTDKVIAQAESKEKQQPAAVPPASNNGDGAVKAVVDFATAALNNRPATSGGDPLAMVKGLVDIVKEIKPAPDTTAADLAKQVVSQAEAANTRIYELQKEQMKDIRAELDKARTPAAAVTQPAPRTDVDVLEEMVKKQNLLKQLTGRGGPTEEVDDKPSNIDKWVEAAPVVAPIVQTLLQGIFQTIHYGLETWQKVAFNNNMAKNGQATTMTPETKASAEPSKPQLTPEQQAQQNRLILMLQGLESAAEPISNALDDGDTGAQFAALIIKMKRRPAYDMIRALGEKTPGVYDFEQFKTNLGNLLQHPSRGPQTAKLWEKVAPLSTFGQFLLDFFNYDEIAAREPQ